MPSEANAGTWGAGPERSFFAWARSPGTDSTAAPRARAQRQLSAARLIVLLAVIAVVATLACGGIGYGLARQSDAHRTAEQRAALRTAIGEFRDLFGPRGEVDPRFVRMVEQSAASRA